MANFRQRRSTPAFRALALGLGLMMALSGCGFGSVVQIKPPYPNKLRPGDGVKITVADGTIHSGRVVYVDRSVVVIRTPRQTRLEHPVKSARFGTTIKWEDVRRVKVAGTLDSKGKLVSNEEIRINRRTNHRLKMVANLGLLGSALSFLGGVQIQDSISPASTDLSTHRHGRARFAFWSTWVGGSLASALAGYLWGKQMDRQRAIGRIERQRESLLKAQLDSIRQQIHLPGNPLLPPQ